MRRHDTIFARQLLSTWSSLATDTARAFRCAGDLIPAWWNKPLKDMKLATFNARAESVATKPMFRSAFKRNRSLIPVSGYYEWEDTPGGKQRWYSRHGTVRLH